MLAREPAVVGVRARGPVDLGEDLNGVSAHALEGPAQNGLGPAQGVNVRRVECGDARVESGADAGDGGILLDLITVGDPIAVGEG